MSPLMGDIFGHIPKPAQNTEIDKLAPAKICIIRRPDVQLFDDWSPTKSNLRDLVEVELVKISEISCAYVLQSLQAILVARLRLMLQVLKETAVPQQGDFFVRCKKEFTTGSTT